MNKLLLATDGSDFSSKAEAQAKTMLKAFPQASLIVIYVSDALVLPPGMIIPKELDEAEQRFVAEIGEKVSESFAAYAGRVSFQNFKGNPVQTICRIADKEKADLIILGSHGRGAINRLLLGSVSHGVLHHTEIPVLVAR